MATNAFRFKGSLFMHDAQPLVMPGKFQAGSTQAIKRGELLELSGGNWIPLDADQAMTAVIAIAACEIKSGDLAGYYPIIVPRPGDLFEFELLSSDAQNPALGAAVYFSSSEVVTTTAGTNVLGDVASHAHYPYPQGFASDDASFDRGTTLRPTPGGKVWITIKEAASFFAALQA